MARRTPPKTHAAPQLKLWNSRPWAAYVLGHDAIALELWWVVFIQAPGEDYRADENVLLCLDLLKQALTELVGETEVSVSAEISRMLAELRSHFVESAGVARSNVASVLPIPWNGEPPCVYERGQLLRLVDRVLSPTNELKVWFRLGEAVGFAQLQLHREAGRLLQLDDLELCEQDRREIKSLLDGVKHTASIVASSDQPTVALIAKLAKLRTSGTADSACRSLERIVVRQALGLPARTQLDNLLMVVDTRLRDQLRDLQVEVERSQASQRQKPGRPTSATGWTAEEEARNKWIYKKHMNGTPYKAIIKELNSLITAGKKWGPIGSIPGITKASDAFAERMGLPQARKRKGGRPKKTLD